MDLRRIRKVTQSNIDRLIDENLYRGITNNDKTIVKVQCMDKDFWITFDFAQEEATIENRLWSRTIEICDMAPNLLYKKIVSATC